VKAADGGIDFDVLVATVGILIDLDMAAGGEQEAGGGKQWKDFFHGAFPRDSSERMTSPAERRRLLLSEDYKTNYEQS
jgi:hypothetical protein